MPQASRLLAGDALPEDRLVSDKVAFELYQIAGRLLLAPDTLTEGQRERLCELLLNVLSEPGRYRARVVRGLARMAVKR